MRRGSRNPAWSLSRLPREPPKTLAAPLPIRTLPEPSHLGAPPPGFEGDGWMGEAHLSLPDRPSSAPASSQGESWGAFYARERIAPYLDDRTFTAAERTLIDKLCERLESGALDHGQPSLVEEAKSRHSNIGAARTHGDLWSGNVMWTPRRCRPY